MHGIFVKYIRISIKIFRKKMRWQFVQTSFFREKEPLQKTIQILSSKSINDKIFEFNDWRLILLLNGKHDLMSLKKFWYYPNSFWFIIFISIFNFSVLNIWYWNSIFTFEIFDIEILKGVLEFWVGLPPKTPKPQNPKPLLEFQYQIFQM